MLTRNYVVRITNQPEQFYSSFYEAIKNVLKIFFINQFPEIKTEQVEHLVDVFSAGFQQEPKKEGYFSIFPDYGIDIRNNLS